MKKIFLTLFFVLVVAQVSYALSNGEYYSTSQQGMMVYLYDGYYELQINNQPYQTGSYTVNGSSITFTPDWTAQGSMSVTTGSITGDCSFSWGAAGNFQSSSCGSSGGTSNTGNTGTTTTNNFQYASLDTSGALLIPELNINGNCYSVLMQLGTIGQTYLFKVTGVNQASYCGSYAATYNNGLLYIPYLNYSSTYYKVYLQLYSTNPDVLFSIYNVGYADIGSINTGSTGGTTNNTGSTTTTTTNNSVLYGCYSPDNADWLMYYCYDGQGNWYEEDWNSISGCTGKLHEGTYQIQSNTLQMCGSSGCTSYSFQTTGNGFTINGESYSSNNGCK